MYWSRLAVIVLGPGLHCSRILWLSTFSLRNQLLIPIAVYMWLVCSFSLASSTHFVCIYTQCFSYAMAMGSVFPCLVFLMFCVLLSVWVWLTSHSLGNLLNIYLVYTINLGFFSFICVYNLRIWLVHGVCPLGLSSSFPSTWFMFSQTSLRNLFSFSSVSLLSLSFFCVFKLLEFFGKVYGFPFKFYVLGFI